MPETVPTSACTHPNREHLGNDGSAEFYRCESCGAVFVVQGRKTWIVARYVTPPGRS